ncbi:MAG: exodeoxyribonuclease VII small subunit [Acidobacteria bacterium]|nr:exodeoxyribonuclease VII small subunit [Acidobacteriota bacterium]
MAETPSDRPALSFEQELAELEAVVKKLESGDLPLEESIRLFERGVALSDSCRGKLDAVETRVEMLVKRGRGVVAQPFDPEK